MGHQNTVLYDGIVTGIGNPPTFSLHATNNASLVLYNFFDIQCQTLKQREGSWEGSGEGRGRGINHCRDTVTWCPSLDVASDLGQKGCSGCCPSEWTGCESDCTEGHMIF